MKRQKSKIPHAYHRQSPLQNKKTLKDYNESLLMLKYFLTQVRVTTIYMSAVHCVKIYFHKKRKYA